MDRDLDIKEKLAQLHRSLQFSTNNLQARVGGMEARLDELGIKMQDLKAVHRAASDLVDKIDSVCNSDEYIGIFAFAHHHGMSYTGDDFRDEFVALKEALSSVSQQE